MEEVHKQLLEAVTPPQGGCPKRGSALEPTIGGRRCTNGDCGYIELPA
jgi:hypothetical protein